MTPGHQVALMHLLREQARIKLHQLKQLVYEKEIKHPPSLARAAFQFCYYDTCMQPSLSISPTVGDTPYAKTCDDK